MGLSVLRSPPTPTAQEVCQRRNFRSQTGKKLAQKHLKLALSYIVPGSRPAASY